MQNAQELEIYFKEKAKTIPQVLQVKGRGLKLGLVFDFPIAELRKKLITELHIFTGNAKNPNLIRILPPLTVQKKHIDQFFEALKKAL
jgi:acetylornithine aminotransferase